MRARWRFWKREPSQCGGEPPPRGDAGPQSGASRIERAEAALAALEAAWAAAANSPHGDALNPRQLALEFRRTLQAKPDLVGWAVHSSWVQYAYPSFARAQGLAFPPAWRLFAEQLGKVMPRRRHDIRQGGKRTCTVTLYRVLDPVAAVVELAAARRSA